MKYYNELNSNCIRAISSVNLCIQFILSAFTDY